MRLCAVLFVPFVCQTDEAVAALVADAPLLLAGFARDGCPVFLRRPTGWSSILRTLTAAEVVWAHIQQARTRVLRLAFFIQSC